MNRNDWERQFRQKLKQQLGLTPEQIKIHWNVCYSQRYTPDQAIAYLIKTHELYPELRILPISTTGQEHVGYTPPSRWQTSSNA
jgi:hypothetical protein